MRADAARNRARLLDAAAAAFAEQGLDVGVAEIARRAGVGQGTFFRHFPTKEELIAAIIEQRIAEVLEVAREAAKDPDPWAGLRRFFTWSLEAQTRDRALKESLAHRTLGDPRYDEARREILDLIGSIIRRGQEAGVLRADLTPQDVPFLLSAVGASADPFPGAPAGIWRRYLAMVMDGLRPAAASDAGEPPPAEAVIELSTSAAGRASARPRS
jgi:AcrR family transcriptional regulator